MTVHFALQSQQGDLSTFQPGTRLGPYEIVAPIGAGGMGEVYRARDTRLGRDVAIKVLPPEFATDPDRLRRFELEARAVAALSHPNVLAIHDVGTHEAIPYLVTELLEGESLRERLKAGGLTVRKAVETAVQIAQGLSAAHEKGIVHRDLKPGNVFVTKDGQVKILDFGLAKLTQLETPQDPYAKTLSGEPATQSGAVLGTMGYTSPEQLRAEQADARSDIFSFGCVLYEMLSGRSPFLKRTGAETASAILTEDPAPLSGTGRAIGPALQEIVHRCLEKRPEDRFSSAHDLALALRAYSGGTETPATAKAPVRVLRMRRSWLVGALGVVLLAVVAALLVWAPWKKATPAASFDPASVVVAVFENQTGDASLDKTGKQIADALTNDLLKTGELKVAVNPAAVGPTGEAGGDPLLRLARATRSALVVAGTYDLRGEQLEVQARVVDPWHDAVAYTSEPVRCQRKDPLAALDSLRQHTTGAVAWRSDRSQSGFWNGFHPPRYDALVEFRLSQTTGDHGHLDKAAALDPDFYAAQLDRVENLMLGDDRPEDAAKKLAVLEANADHLMPGEHLYLRHCRAELDGDLASALTIYRDLATWSGYPVEYLRRIAQLEMWVNHPAEAIRDLSAFLASTDANAEVDAYNATSVLALAHHRNRDYEGELRIAREGQRRFTGKLGLQYQEVFALAALGRLDEIEKVIKTCEAVGTHTDIPLTNLLTNLAAELRVHGHREAGLRMAQRAMAWWTSQHIDAAQCQPCWWQSYLAALLQSERWAEARAVAGDLHTKDPSDIELLGQVGALAARLGDVEQARKTDAELAALKRPYLYGEHIYRRACIAALLGEKERAMELLREAFQQGRHFDTPVHREINLEPLWGYPPFEELNRPKG